MPSQTDTLQGSMTALATPFLNGGLDLDSFAQLIEWQIEGGTRALVPCGTTGESPTLSHEEHRQLIEACLEFAGGRVPVIAGTGSNSTREAILLTQHAEKAGAQACLVVTPYYNRPSQEAMVEHFTAIHDATRIPIFIYNIPPRSAVDLELDTMDRLAALPRIIGVKDATADLARPLRQLVQSGDAFLQLSGEDITALAFLAQGGHGCISVSANAAPHLCARMHQAWQDGDTGQAMELMRRLAPLHDAMFCEPSPAPVKYALARLGVIASEETRLPILPLSRQGRDRMDRALDALALRDRTRAS